METLLVVRAAHDGPRRVVLRLGRVLLRALASTDLRYGLVARGFLNLIAVRRGRRRGLIRPDSRLRVRTALANSRFHFSDRQTQNFLVCHVDRAEGELEQLAGPMLRLLD